MPPFWSVSIFGIGIIIASIDRGTRKEIVEIGLMSSLLTETAKEGLATKEDIYALKEDISNLKFDMIKWMIGLLLGQTALILTIIRLFFIK